MTFQCEKVASARREVGHVPFSYHADAEVQASEGVAHDPLSGGGAPDLPRLIVVALGVAMGVVMVGGGASGNRSHRVQEVLLRRKRSRVHPLQV